MNESVLRGAGAEVHQGKESDTQTRVNHPNFSALYEWLVRGAAERYFLGFLRLETASKASGVG